MITLMVVLLEVTILLVLVVANGLLAGAEIAVVSSRKVPPAPTGPGRGQGGRQGAGAGHSPNRFLSTIQIGITEWPWRRSLRRRPGGRQPGAPPGRARGPARFASELAIVVVVVVITYVTLVVGELVPKRIALHDPEGWPCPGRRAHACACPARHAPGAAPGLVHGSGPPVRPAQGAREEAEITEEEIRGMIAHATEAGRPGGHGAADRGAALPLSDATVDMHHDPATPSSGSTGRRARGVAPVPGGRPPHPVPGGRR
jgi:putative hemolysin